MNATELLTELRPPLKESPSEDGTIERILLAGPEPTPPPRRGRYARPIALAGVTAMVAIAAVALAPSGGSGPVGLAGAAAALNEPDVLLHFKVTMPGGAMKTAETWQTPDGRRTHTIYGNGIEIAYDQERGVMETYLPDRNEVIADTDPEAFAQPFGSIATSPTASPERVGDLPALVTRALSGDDPKVRHIGRTTVRGIDVDQIRVEQNVEVADAVRGASPKEVKDAPRKTITMTRDIYVRHDNALPVRVVDHRGGFWPATTTSEFTEAQKLTLDASSEPMLTLGHHPGATRTVRGRFDDSAAGAGAEK